MRVHRRSDDTIAPSSSSVAIGNFDGVHLGHQALFDRARSLARQEDGTAVALTFDPHPARFFEPELAPPLITTEAQKLQPPYTFLDKALMSAFTTETPTPCRPPETL